MIVIETYNLRQLYFVILRNITSALNHWFQATSPRSPPQPANLNLSLAYGMNLTIVSECPIPFPILTADVIIYKQSL